MFQSVSIEGYRGFRKFSMSGLGRVNLLVGTNNSGKTSVLEAIQLLASAGNPEVIWQTLTRRGEVVTDAPTQDVGFRSDNHTAQLKVGHLFGGHDVETASPISLERDSGAEWVRLGLAERQEAQDNRNFDFGSSRFALKITSSQRTNSLFLPVSRQGGLTVAALEIPPRHPGLKVHGAIVSEFITTESQNAAKLFSYWNKIVLTPSEELVLQALRFIDPKIERIAPQLPSTNSLGSFNRGGFVVKQKDTLQPVPIGSMGEGMWRMLALAMAITQCKGGVLLVDEIDTGLHYSVMSKMWNLIFNAAKEFDVQVFATTHSYDCVYSLAQIEHSGDPSNRVTVQRIEAGREQSVPYDEAEISVGADRSIEMR